MPLFRKNARNKCKTLSSSRSLDDIEDHEARKLKFIATTLKRVYGFSRNASVMSTRSSNTSDTSSCSTISITSYSADIDASNADEFTTTTTTTTTSTRSCHEQLLCSDSTCTTSTAIHNIPTLESEQHSHSHDEHIHFHDDQRQDINVEYDSEEEHGAVPEDVHHEGDEFEMRRICREATMACLWNIIEHLFNFTEDHREEIESYQVTAPASASASTSASFCNITYEDWIKSLHPENVHGGVVDHRFYIRDSEHRMVWNELVVDILSDRMDELFVPPRYGTGIEGTM